MDETTLSARAVRGRRFSERGDAAVPFQASTSPSRSCRMTGHSGTPFFPFLRIPKIRCAHGGAVTVSRKRHLHYIDRKGFSRSLASVAIVLTLLAGYIDAIGYLSLGHIYVANMSGNSVAVGIQASHMGAAQVWRSLWPILSFMAGVLISRLIVGWGLRAAWRSLAAPMIAFETVALAGFTSFSN